MTRQQILCVLSILLWCWTGNFISAFQQEDVADAGDDFNLSEPEVDSSASKKVTPAATVPANSPARQVPRIAAENAAPIQSDSAKNPAANAERTNAPATPSAAHVTRPPSSQAAIDSQR
jgi:uncharacterized iron-regulated membrane protein